MGMELTQSTSMRQEMRLTPRMIQSMEILQLPLMALEERIEQELQNNPVLELRDPEDDGTEVPDTTEDQTKENTEAEQPMVVKDNDDSSEDFDRLEKISEYLDNEEFRTNSGFNHRAANQDGERDKKLDAMNNTAARSGTLIDHLLGQWAFVDTTPQLKIAGEAIINNIGSDGYLHLSLETIRTDSKTPLTLEDLEIALKLVQDLEPAGVGARNVRECLLLQLNALEQEGDEDHDYSLERKIVSDHLKDLELNRYPQIAKKLGTSIEEIQKAVRGLRRLHPHPGKLIGSEDAPAITPDARIYLDEDTGQYEIAMTHDPAMNLYISGTYRRMLQQRTADKKTREFLNNNVRNARWLLDSIEQRKGTILRVIRVVVDAQRDFFDKGPEFLRPLPMIQVADQLGIHVATVSRAVHDKWIQTPRGVFPLRRFFSGGTTSSEGEDMSWDAVKEKLKTIIDNEDRLNPLNDDDIVKKFAGQGIELARRTVAKYRKVLNIASARQRRAF